MNGKLFLFAGVSLGTILLSTLLLLGGWENTWRLWNVPTMSPCFADARVITSGAETKALGGDPLVDNPRDPWGRQLNYPRIWQMLYRVGINQSHTAYLGITLVALLVIGLFLYTPSPLDKTTSTVLIVAIFSPAVLLGVEQGNIDLLMFFLLSAAIFCMKKNGTAAKGFAIALVLIAFVLKLFPLFGMGVVLQQKKDRAVKAGLLAAIFAFGYAAANYADLVIIRRVTPQNPFRAYGIDTLWMKADNSCYWRIITAELSYAAIAVCLVLALFGIGSQKFWHTEASDHDPRTLDAFRVGSGIYIGTFLLGNNAAYRLVFLLFVIPQLIFWSKQSSPNIAGISRLMIPAILISMWSMFLERLATAMHVGFGGTLLQDVSNWLIFPGLLLLFACSVPKWIKDAAASLDTYLRRST
jgi:hypothetical protein